MKISSRQIIEDSWGFLDKSDAGAGYRVRDLSQFQTAQGSILVSQDSEGGRHVLVPIRADEEVVLDTESRGVQIVRTSLEDAGTRRQFVDIRCSTPRLYRVFDLVAASMLDALAANEGPVAPACAEVLAKWRALLRRAAKPLSATSLRGVFGELWFLAQLAQHSPVALDYWVGPDDAPQDFISARGAFELKTTLRNPARRVSISGIDQLDESPHPYLTLVVVSVAEDPQGEHLEQLVDTLVSAGCVRERVLDQLAKAGVQEEDLSELAMQRYRICACTGYRVEGEFPRLSSGTTLPVGIHNLRYEVELGACRAHVLSDSELIALQREFLGVDS